MDQPMKKRATAVREQHLEALWMQFQMCAASCHQQGMPDVECMKTAFFAAMRSRETDSAPILYH